MTLGLQLMLISSGGDERAPALGSSSRTTFDVLEPLLLRGEEVVLEPKEMFPPPDTRPPPSFESFRLRLFFAVWSLLFARCRLFDLSKLTGAGGETGVMSDAFPAIERAEEDVVPVFGRTLLAGTIVMVALLNCWNMLLVLSGAAFAVTGVNEANAGGDVGTDEGILSYERNRFCTASE